MKLHFKISYFTYWGQRLLVSGNIPELGNNDFSRALPLNFQSPEDWTAEIELSRTAEFDITYRYILYNEHSGKYDEEWGNDRKLVLDSSKTEHFFCIDTWNSPSSIENVFLSTPYQDVLLKNETDTVDENSIQPKKYTHVFRVKMPLIGKNETLCMIGDCEQLGNWSTANPAMLMKSTENYWFAKLDLSKVKRDIHYKYGICDTETGQFRYFESGPDHIAAVYNSKKTVVQKADGFVRIANYSWKGAGVGLPMLVVQVLMRLLNSMASLQGS